MKKTVNYYTIISPVGKSPEEGGGGISGNDIIRYINECGLKVKVCTPKDKFLDPKDSVFNVLHDPFNDPIGSDWFSLKQMNEISDANPYMYIECAYTSCTINPYGMKKNSICEYDYEATLINLSKNYMSKAKRFVVNSPLHLLEIEKYAKKTFENTFFHIKEIDTELFRNLNLKRDIKYLYVGAINNYKGLNNIKKKFPSIQTYGNPYNPISHKDLPKLYSRAKHFVHLPNWKETFGRTVCEASLCGCNIIANENVGCLSYNHDLTDVNWYKQGKENFINMIKKDFL